MRRVFFCLYLVTGSGFLPIKNEPKTIGLLLLTGFFMTTNAILVLADGSVFHGISIGAAGYAVGEVVFNTSMTGYQEILTDPSYTRQMVTLTIHILVTQALMLKISKVTKYMQRV